MNTTITKNVIKYTAIGVAGFALGLSAYIAKKRFYDPMKAKKEAAANQEVEADEIIKSTDTVDADEFRKIFSDTESNANQEVVESVIDDEDIVVESDEIPGIIDDEAVIEEPAETPSEVDGETDEVAVTDAPIEE